MLAARLFDEGRNNAGRLIRSIAVFLEPGIVSSLESSGPISRWNEERSRHRRHELPVSAQGHCTDIF
jgi:hypothetical protein